MCVCVGGGGMEKDNMSEFSANENTWEIKTYSLVAFPEIVSCHEISLILS